MRLLRKASGYAAGHGWKSQRGASMVEMLIATIILFTFVLALFAIGAGYWNDTFLHSTSQNASLTAQSIIDSDLRTANLSTIQSECQQTTRTTNVVAPECPGGLLNPWHAVQSVVAGSTENLLLVPKAAEGECLKWWTPSPERVARPLAGPIVPVAVGNSSWDTTFTLSEGQNGNERATQVSVSAPFRPIPLPSGNGTPGAEECSGAVTVQANSVARSYTP